MPLCILLDTINQPIIELHPEQPELKETLMIRVI